MGAAIIKLLVGFVVFSFLLGSIAGLVLKYFAPKLTWGQSFSISFLSAAISILFILAVVIVSNYLGLPKTLDSLAGVALLALFGTLITNRAKTHGVEKTGWLGVGGKTTLVVLVLSWVPVIIYLLSEAM